MRRVMNGLAVVCVLMTMSGCVFSVGGKSTQSTTPPTLGQEMIDLKTAYEQGAMSEEEYQQARTMLIMRGNQQAAKQ